MKQKLFTFKSGLLTKLLLSFTLLLAGVGKIMADDYTATLTFANSTLPVNWENGGTYDKITYNSFTLNDGFIESANNYSTYSLTSESTTLQLSRGQKIVITARVRTGYTAGYQNIKVRYSADGGSKFNDLMTFNSSHFSSNTDFVEMEYVINSDALSSCCIQFLAQKAAISSIEFKAAEEEEEEEEIDELTFDEGTDIPEGFSSLTTTTSIPNVYVKYTPKSGWNTICMPFQLKGSNEEYSDIMNDIFGEECWKAYSLKSYADGVLSFKLRTQYLGMSANTPYLVYTTNPPTKPEVGFNFQNINITYSTNLGYNSSETNGVTFQGTYAPKDVGTLTGCYGVTSDGHIAKGGSGAYMKGYRAYFTGITDSEVKMMILEGDDETDLGFVKIVDENAKDVYTLTGQKVQKGRKGIYIVNGKKVVIK